MSNRKTVHVSTQQSTLITANKRALRDLPPAGEEWLRQDLPPALREIEQKLALASIIVKTRRANDADDLDLPAEFHSDAWLWRTPAYIERAIDRLCTDDGEPGFLPCGHDCFHNERGTAMLVCKHAGCEQRFTRAAVHAHRVATGQVDDPTTGTPDSRVAEVSR